MVQTAPSLSAFELRDRAKKIAKVLEGNRSPSRVYRVSINGEDHGLVRLDQRTRRRFLKQFDGEVDLTIVEEACEQNWVYVDQYLIGLEHASDAPAHIWFGPSGFQHSLSWMRQQAQQGRSYSIMGIYRWPKPYQ